MPDYRRAFAPGGTFFFTVCTHRRRPLFTEQPNHQLLRQAFQSVRAVSPFTIDAFVLLPDHLHTIWTLPQQDSNFSARWARIKLAFTHSFLAAAGQDLPVSVAKQNRHRRGIWQPRFWEHLIRDLDDLNNHFDYLHYNPVKHSHAPCPHSWPHSSFHRHVALGNYPPDWLCCCNNRHVIPPNFDTLPLDNME